MDQSDRHRSLADGRGHPLDRSASDIAGGEDAGDVGFEHLHLPAGFSRAGYGRRSGPEVTVVVESKTAA
jgi:hypothetical protein